jgi:hypothetical protein
MMRTNETAIFFITNPENTICTLIQKPDNVIQEWELVQGYNLVKLPERKEVSSLYNRKGKKPCTFVLEFYCSGIQTTSEEFYICTHSKQKSIVES